MKTLILLEMVVLAGGSLITLRNKGATWQAVLFHDAIKRLIAVLILLILLLTAEEVGLGPAAALFGGLVTLGYVLAAIGTLGPALQAATNELFVDTGSAQTSVNAVRAKGAGQG